MKNTKESGITLVALTITIIVLIIISTIGISSLRNQSLVGTAHNSMEEFNVSKELNQTDQLSLRFDQIETEEINSPMLKTGMTPIKWIDGNEVTTTKDDKEWYNYKRGDNQTDSKDSLWANVKLNGSYYVWIPRFAYKITYYTNESRTEVSDTKTSFGKVDVKFLIGLSDMYYETETSSVETAKRCMTATDEIDASSEYIVHPAFTQESNIEYRNGGYSTELTGIWVAKYEMSMETNGVATDTNTELQGNIPTSAEVKMVSKPGATSWRFINNNNAYRNCLNYNEKMQSHLMKNSEWGAVAYLAYSQYGRNGNELAINNSNTYTTGNSGESTTGNITGVFDMSGGASEIVSAFIENENTNGNEMVSGNDKFANHYSEYTSNIYGDGIFETSTENSGNTSWNSDSSFFPTESFPFIIRGGKYDDVATAGLFAYNNTNGEANEDNGFRVVLY